MPDMSLIAGTVSSLKLAHDMAKALVTIRDTTMLNEKVIELQRVILVAQSDALSAQSDQFSLLDRIRDLEKEIADLKGWEAEKQRYDLKDLGFGTFTYLIKPETQGREPIHCICANCYEHGKKSIVQRTGQIEAGCQVWICSDCKSRLLVRQWPPVAQDRSSMPATSAS
jgi:hypothetical protein